MKLVLNAGKTTVMVLTKSKKEALAVPQITTTQGKEIERVSSYKYLGFLLDEGLTFKLHIDTLVKKLRLKLGSFYRNRACFSSVARKRIVLATFLPLLDYGDILYVSPKCSITKVGHGVSCGIAICDQLGISDTSLHPLYESGLALLDITETVSLVYFHL